MNKNAKDMVLMAAQEELDSAVAQHGLFHSPHEAWAVLYEEFQELAEQAGIVDEYRRNIDKLFGYVRKDKKVDCVYLQLIYDWAKCCAFEAVQVMAMCKKWQQSVYQDYGNSTDKESETE